MDPVLKLWLEQQWLGDQRDDAELAKNHAYLLGSFSNPDAVQKMMNENVHESSDEDYEESLKMVLDNPFKSAEDKAADKVTKGKRRRRSMPKENMKPPTQQR